MKKKSLTRILNQIVHLLEIRDQQMALMTQDLEMAKADPRAGLRKGTIAQPDGSGYQGYILDYRHDGVRWIAIVEYDDGTLDAVAIGRVQLTDFCGEEHGID